MQAMRPLIYTAIFTGLMVLGAHVTVPLGPVPFVLSDFFVLLSGLVMGYKYAPLSVAAYLLLGALGLPVFADGGGGWAHFAGPTGGYLFGFLVASYVVGRISSTSPRAIGKDLLAVLAGYALIYALGVTWLKLATGIPWSVAAQAGWLDFLFPMALKSSGSVLLALLIRKSGWVRL